MRAASFKLNWTESKTGAFPRFDLQRYGEANQGPVAQPGWFENNVLCALRIWEYSMMPARAAA